MPSERRYSEKEMRAIFERAARRASPGGPAGEAGLTLAELQEIGAAAGLTAADVAAAAGELDAPAAPKARILGFTRDVTRSRRLPGPVSDEAWGQIVAELRRLSNTDGVLSEVGRIRSWTSSSREGEVPLRASLEPEGDGYRLTLAQRPGDVAAVLTAIPTGLGALLCALGAVVERSPLAVAFVLAFAAAYFAIRAAYERWVRRAGRDFERLLDRAEAFARPAMITPEASRRAPLLGLDGEASPEAEDAVLRARTRA